ncbi:hypothetical protein BJV82DRAFT_662806 [Fennellomyces sp. T-0311]|nr:hypothetical protein BJV82DRAFT_662806 [Fennellomyces sp. T-0311]
MSTTGLPTEIFENISASLSQKDLIQCSWVNRAWNAAFSRVIFRTVTIRTRKELRQFFRQLHKWQETSQLGGAIRELSIDYRIDAVSPSSTIDRRKIGLSSEEFNQLPTLCPALEKLDFQPRMWNHIGFSGNMKQWRNMKQVPAFNNMNAFGSCTSAFGRSLTHLTLQGDIVEKIQKRSAWRTVLLELPFLAHLDLNAITHIFMTERFDLNFKEIHQSCKLLKSLHLENISLGNAPPAFSTQQHTLQKLVLKRAKVRDPQWLRYIAVTFPRLEVLDMEIRWDLNPHHISDGQQQEFHEAYNAIGHCHQLRALYLRQINESLFPDTFFDLMRNQLTDLYIMFIHNYISPSQSRSQTVLQKLLPAMRADATSLGFKNWYRMMNVDEILTPLKRTCENLTTFELEGQSSSVLLPEQNIVLSTIFKELPHLKSLTLRYFDLREHESSGTYPLVSFTLSNCTFMARLFKALAADCPDLKNIALADCTFVNEDSPTEMIISMPQHNLETFTAANIHAVTIAGTYRVLLSTAFFGLERTAYREKTIRRKQKRQHRRKYVPPEWKHSFVRWYHLYETVGGADERLRRLRPDEVESLTTYQRDPIEFPDDSSLDEHGFGFQDDGFEDTERLTYNLMEDWRDDVQYGYLFLQCRSIRKVLFGISGKLEFSDCYVDGY